MTINPALMALMAATLIACSGRQAPAESAPATETVEDVPFPSETDINETPVTFTLVTPRDGAVLTSPLTVSGIAPAHWFFENSFPVRLQTESRIIAEAPATPDRNWTEPGPKTYTATLEFVVEEPTDAFLVLEEDMPGEDDILESRRRAVRLVP